jgi:hypothetical protein
MKWLAPTFKVANMKLTARRYLCFLKRLTSQLRGMIMDIPVGLFPLYSGPLFHTDNATIYAGWEVLLWLNGWKCEKDTKLDGFAPLIELSVGALKFSY